METPYKPPYRRLEQLFQPVLYKLSVIDDKLSYLVEQEKEDLRSLRPKCPFEP